MSLKRKLILVDLFASLILMSAIYGLITERVRAPFPYYPRALYEIERAWATGMARVVDVKVWPESVNIPPGTQVQFFAAVLEYDGTVKCTDGVAGAEIGPWKNAQSCAAAAALLDYSLAQMQDTTIVTDTLVVVDTTIIRYVLKTILDVFVDGGLLRSDTMLTAEADTILSSFTIIDVDTFVPPPPPPPPSTSPPVAPDSLTIRQITGPALRLTWRDRSIDESGFLLERQRGLSGPLLVRDTVPTNIEEYVDSAVNRGVEYCYKLRAINSVGTSDYANAPAFPWDPQRVCLLVR